MLVRTSKTAARPGSRLAGGILAGLAAVLTFGMSATAALASDDVDPAPRVCGDRAAILTRLEQRHEETREGLGLASDGGVLELLVSPEGSWTLLVTYPDRPTCVVAVGQAWQAAGPGGQKV